jgi:hypothetical protein
MARVSNKARSRRAAAASANRAGGRLDPEEVLDRVMSGLLDTMAAGDPLRAELHVAMTMGMWHAGGKIKPDDIDAFVFGTLVEGAERRRTPESAALLRLVTSLGSPAIKKSAGQALARLTTAGIYPPEWVTEIGKAVPLRAWRRYDVFGDSETFAATFRYGEREHGIAVRVKLTAIPVATVVAVTPEAADLDQILNAEDDPFERVEPIGLAEARRHLAGPLAFLDDDPGYPGISTDTRTFLPIARSRVRRLPADDGQHDRVYTAADRAAAVEAFLSSPQAAEVLAADPGATRFWAEVLTGYSSRIPGEPPAQVGPSKLADILLGHVPNTFTLSPAQRRHLEPAVTAWARWSAAHRGLDEAATARLTADLPDTLARFDKLYDHPDSAEARGYVTDLATSDADVSWLLAQFSRRLFAVPLSAPDGLGRHPDVGDRAARRVLTGAEFEECSPPDGMTSEQFVAAAVQVVDEIWEDDPPETYAAANRMSPDGTDRHDVIHTLAARRRSSAVR